ncbi:MAG: N-acetylneuraminate synthase [Pseudodesulfovibrio sp.]|nr:N-acetylneuraminate synthase [Pseudodesulfovibrio sp.]
MSHSPVFIIAEAGVNHNGDMNIARKLIEAAADSGADAIKFQTFKATEIVTSQAQKATYQKEASNTEESQLEMLEKLELDESMHVELKAHCQKKSIEFLSTPFDGKSLDMLLEMGLSTIKIPSGEITNLPYLRHVGSMGKRIILSTGMTTLQEVKEAVQALEKAGTSSKDITLLHCNTQYPTPYDNANLRAMETLAQAFPECAVGYSDHTLGIECPIAATALGATVIEKHFTLDKTMDGPDHAASISPDELSAMVTGIRNTEKALGTGHKEPSPSEIDNISIARRFLVASRPIIQGELFNESNLTAKRTGCGGISPMQWDKIIGQSAPHDFQSGETITL